MANPSFHLATHTSEQVLYPEIVVSADHKVPDPHPYISRQAPAPPESCRAQTLAAYNSPAQQPAQPMAQSAPYRDSFRTLLQHHRTVSGRVQEPYTFPSHSTSHGGDE